MKDCDSCPYYHDCGYKTENNSFIDTEYRRFMPPSDMCSIEKREDEEEEEEEME